MASNSATAPSLVPPLLVWREHSEIERLENEIAALAARAARYRPHSHARLELEMRQRALRARQLGLECELKGRPSGKRS